MHHYNLFQIRITPKHFVKRKGISIDSNIPTACQGYTFFFTLIAQDKVPTGHIKNSYGDHKYIKKG